MLQPKNKIKKSKVSGAEAVEGAGGRAEHQGDQERSQKKNFAEGSSYPQSNVRAAKDSHDVKENEVGEGFKAEEQKSPRSESSPARKLFDESSNSKSVDGDSGKRKRQIDEASEPQMEFFTRTNLSKFSADQVRDLLAHFIPKLLEIENFVQLFEEDFMTGRWIIKNFTPENFAEVMLDLLPTIRFIQCQQVFNLIQAKIVGFGDPESENSVWADDSLNEEISQSWSEKDFTFDAFNKPAVAKLELLRLQNQQFQAKGLGVHEGSVMRFATPVYSGKSNDLQVQIHMREKVQALIASKGGLDFVETVKPLNATAFGSGFDSTSAFPDVTGHMDAISKGFKVKAPVINWSMLKVFEGAAFFKFHKEWIKNVELGKEFGLFRSLKSLIDVDLIGTVKRRCDISEEMFKVITDAELATKFFRSTPM